MAAPVDAGRAPYDGTTSQNVHPVSLPGSISAGDTLVMLLRINNATTSGPSGWSPLASSSADASDDTTYVFYKKATGSEGATVNVTLDGGVNRKIAGATWRITGAADPTVTPPEISTVATGTSTTPDPGNLAPSGGSDDYLWLWLGTWEGLQDSPPATPPTDFSNWIGGSSGSVAGATNNTRCAGGSRQFTGSSLDPPSVTISASDDWTAYTVAVYPATGGGADITGAASLTVTAGITTAGKRTGTGVSTSTYTVGVASTGQRETFSSASTTITTGIASAAVSERFAASTSTYTVGITSTGARSQFGAASTTVTFGVASTGQYIARGVSSSTVTLGVTSTAFSERFAAAATNIAFGVVSSGTYTAKGASSTTITVGISSAFKDAILGEASLNVVVNIASTATREATAAAAQTFTLGVASTGTRIALGSSASTYTLGIVSAGKRFITGASSSTYTVGIVSAGTQYKRALASVTLTLGISTASASSTRSSASLGLFIDIYSNGPRRHTFAPVVEDNLTLVTEGEDALTLTLLEEKTS